MINFFKKTQASVTGSVVGLASQLSSFASSHPGLVKFGMFSLLLMKVGAETLKECTENNSDYKACIAETGGAYFGCALQYCNK